MSEGSVTGDVRVRMGAGGGGSNKVGVLVRSGGCIGVGDAVGDGSGEGEGDVLDGNGKSDGAGDEDEDSVASGRRAPAARTVTDPTWFTVDTASGNAETKASVQACVVNKLSP